ncbi:MAG TPA: hypothetical protein VFZ21_33070 [Gemmatimonadaceae bacterium]|jgi:hypothetical protein|nr:hypothetical protein [Gemmatimonadaceae bacterium]
MTSSDNPLDSRELAELRRIWAARAEALRDILQRFDHRGMTRPARDPEERAWLAEQGREQWFTDDERYVEAARAYYARKYSR